MNHLLCTGSELSKFVFNPENCITQMQNILVDDETLLASFGERQYKQSKNYFEAIKLHREISNVSEIARLVGCPNRTVQGWINGGHMPSPIRQLNFLKSLGLMPLVAGTSKEFTLFTELVAFLFGDGHLMNHLGAFTLFGQKADLEELSIKVEKVYSVKSNVEPMISKSEIRKLSKGKIHSKLVSGLCWRINVNSSPLARLLHLSGVPAGDKVSLITRVPEWILSGDTEIKRIFLGVLFGNEFQCPRIRAKNAFSSPQFGLHKIEDKKAELRIFLEQLRNLLTEFGISTSSVCEDRSYKSVRKDGTLSVKMYFCVDSHAPNIVKLFNAIPFRYSEKKQKRFSRYIAKFMESYPALKKEWEIYSRVMELHASGLGRRKIFKKLALPKAYFYKINSWIHYGTKPLYYSDKFSP